MRRSQRSIKKAQDYRIWRDEVAIPYLVETYGAVCAKCGTGERYDIALDVDHRDGRGKDKTQNLDNVQFLCRRLGEILGCHQIKHTKPWEWEEPERK